MKAAMKKYETLFHRHSANPILTGKDWPYSINSVFNAGATLPSINQRLLCRLKTVADFRFQCGAFGERRERLANRLRTNFAARTRKVSKRFGD
jgi:predicted GH43/DUF377 family glycosyl hydrolase